MNQIYDTARLGIHSRVEGAGLKLLFLGGSNFDLGIRAAVFDSDLPRHFTVAAADPRGLGQTEAPAGDWVMQDYARDAVALLDMLGWASVLVLGESFGGMVALHLALLAPDRVSRLAIAVAAPGGEGGRSYPVQDHLDVVSPERRAEAALILQDRRFRDLPADRRQQDIAQRVVREREFMAHRENGTGYPRLLAARAGHDCRDRLREIVHPSLVLAGRYDDQAPSALSRSLVSRLPDAILSEHDAGHALLFNHPAALPAVHMHFEKGSSS